MVVTRQVYAQLMHNRQGISYAKYRFERTLDYKIDWQFLSDIF